MRKVIAKSIVLISLLFLLGCKQMPNLKSLTIDNHNFKLEIAQNDLDRERGLMDRKDLPKDRGMLFIFDSAEKLSFWMKNTQIPLQIIFINGCKVVDVQEMIVERDPLNPSKSYTSKFPADKAIEINANSVNDNIIGQNINELCQN